MACVFLILCFFSQIVNLIWNVIYILKQRHGLLIFFALGELFIVVRYFVNDVTRWNTLPQDVQLPHYCISKYVALRDILAVTNVGPLIFSRLFTVNKVVYCKSDVCSLSAVLSSSHLFSSYLVNIKKRSFKSITHL